MIYGDLRIAGAQNYEDQGETSSSITNNTEILLPIYSSCLNRLSRHIEINLAKTIIEDELEKINYIWNELSHAKSLNSEEKCILARNATTKLSAYLSGDTYLIPEGYNLCEVALEVEEGIEFDEEEMETEVQLEGGVLGIESEDALIKNNELFLCFLERINAENTEDNNGKFILENVSIINTIAETHIGHVGCDISTIIGSILDSLISAASKDYSLSSLEEVLSMLIDNGLHKSPVLISEHTKIKEIIRCYVDKYQLKYIEERVNVPSAPVMLCMMSRSIGEICGQNKFTKFILDLPGKNNRPSLYDSFASCQFSDTVKSITCASIPFDFWNLLSQILSKQKQEQKDGSFAKDIKTLLAIQSSSNTELGKIINRKIMTAASEQREFLDTAFVNAIVSAIEHKSPVSMTDANNHNYISPNAARIDPKSLEKLIFLELFIEGYCTNQSRISKYSSLLLSKLSLKTENTSVKVLSHSEKLLKYFKHPQCPEISSNLHIKFNSKIDDLSQKIVLFLEETKKTEPGCTKSFFTNLLSLLEEVSVELIHLPDSPTSFEKLIEKSIQSVSSEEVIILTGKFLSSKWMKIAKKTITKLGKTSKSLLPQETLDMISKFEKIILKNLPSSMTLRKSKVLFHEEKFDESEVKNTVLSVLGFSYCSEYSHSYHHRNNLPVSYVRMVQNVLLPSTSSDILEELIVNGVKYKLPVTLLKDLDRSSYKIGEDKILRSKIVGVEEKYEQDIQLELGVQFIEGAIKLGLSKEAIEVAASLMNQYTAAVMLNAGWVPNHIMFPLKSGLGIAPMLSEDTIFTLERSTSGEHIIKASISGHGKILHAQEKELIDITKNREGYIKNIIAIAPTEHELSSIVNEIELKSNIELRIKQDGSVEVIKVRYELPNLCPEKISKICNSNEVRPYLHF